MSLLKKKAKRKCNCGRPVAEGSVFCPHCMAEIQKKNAKMVKSEDKKNRRNIRSKWNEIRKK
jgi:uncharacterized Zn finger protein (UPF0148 family)